MADLEAMADQVVALLSDAVGTYGSFVPSWPGALTETEDAAEIPARVVVYLLSRRYKERLRLERALMFMAVPDHGDTSSVLASLRRNLRDVLANDPSLVHRLADVLPAVTDADRARLLGAPMPPDGGSPDTGSGLVSLSVYLESESAHPAVRSAVEDYLAAVGLEVVEDDEPVIGSWFWTARAKQRASEAVESLPDLAMATAWGPNRTRQASNNLTDSQAAANLLHALVTSGVPGVIRIGSLLAAYDGHRSMVISLSPAQVNELELRPALFRSPEAVLEFLESYSGGTAETRESKSIQP